MRSAGILMPISSLSSPYGIGSFGEKAYRFIDFLANSRQKYWQILPLGPTGYGDSPYQSFSAFAINNYYIDLDILCDSKLITKEEINSFDFGDSEKVEYFMLFQNRKKILEKAVSRFDTNNEGFIAFKNENSFWLKDYALFMSIKNAHKMVSYTLWDEKLRIRDEKTIKKAEKTYSNEILFWEVCQFWAYSQWLCLKEYANSKNIKIIGDIPIYVSPDSSDIWVNHELFQMDENRQMTEVAGCPPDAFSADGQLWGNPLYDWDYHSSTGYDWWIKRLANSKLLYDVTRIDHFRAFSGYYAIKFGEKTAKNGRWRIGPAVSIIQTLKGWFPDIQIIAEDLGYLTPDVLELLKYSGYPGMKVLQFAFGSDGSNAYLPHNYEKNTVVYTGTHDNTTSLDWLNTASEHEIEFCKEYLACSDDENFTQAMIRAAYSSIADCCIIPIADWLSLDKTARINTPSTIGDNWVWRIDENSLDENLSKQIELFTRIYSRD